MAPRLKFATVTAAVEDIVVRRGECWDAPDDFVRRHPDLFSNAPTVVWTSEGAIAAALFSAPSRPEPPNRVGTTSGGGRIL